MITNFTSDPAMYFANMFRQQALANHAVYLDGDWPIDSVLTEKLKEFIYGTTDLSAAQSAEFQNNRARARRMVARAHEQAVDRDRRVTFSSAALRDLDSL